MTTEVRKGGIGFLGVLVIGFVIAKLTGFVAWSWWLVLAPVWIPYALVLAIVGVALLAAVLA